MVVRDNTRVVEKSFDLQKTILQEDVLWCNREHICLKANGDWFEPIQDNKVEVL